MTVGYKKDYSPSEKFDTEFYYNTYHDIKHVNMNPLVHYINFGQKEGRKIRPVKSRTRKFKDKLLDENSSSKKYLLFQSKFNPINYKQKLNELHKLGFKVMLWLVPCVSPDSYTFREARNNDVFYKNHNKTNVQIMEWWDGFSAVLDFTNPNALIWLKDKCDNLKNNYGIDGFKFDGADDCFYPSEGKFYKDVPRIHQQRIYSEFASDYSLNEMRACFNTQGKGLAQRLTDKAHSWDNRGLNMLIPNGLAMSILGYRYCCPDMIGGGLVGNFVDNNYKDVDQQLFVRYAQVATFFPMMQFSLAPWKFLNKTNLKIVKECCNIHDKISDYIKELVIKSSKDGSPIMRNMEYEYPNQGYATITDQFLLGNKYLVAPVLLKDTFKRKVVLPEGIWEDELGNEYHGNQTIEIDNLNLTKEDSNYNYPLIYSNVGDKFIIDETGSLYVLK